MYLFEFDESLKISFYVNCYASAAIINYLNKLTCENGIFDLRDLYDLDNDVETQN